MGIVTIVIIALLSVGGIYAYANYDPATFNGIINNIPGISTSENKLKDCSIYKKQYSKDFSDNQDTMITGALDGVAKTRACEKYNAQLQKQSEAERTAVLNAEARAIQEKYERQVEEEAQRNIEEETRYGQHNPRMCADLTQKDLRACDLRQYGNLRDRDFSYANLYWAILSDMDLSRSNFTGANLNNAYLGNTNTTGAIFTGCRGIPQNTPIICTPNMGGWK